MSNDDTLSSATVTIQKYIRLSNAQQQYQQLSIDFLVPFFSCVHSETFVLVLTIRHYYSTEKMNTKRTGLVKEILATETNYVNRLTILEEVQQFQFLSQTNTPKNKTITKKDIHLLIFVIL